ncbi:MAG: hypothetical protein AAF193_07990, partial [Bacteroidota bacterium]
PEDAILHLILFPGADVIVDNIQLSLSDNVGEASQLWNQKLPLVLNENYGFSEGAFLLGNNNTDIKIEWSSEVIAYGDEGVQNTDYLLSFSFYDQDNQPIEIDDLDPIVSSFKGHDLSEHAGGDYYVMDYVDDEYVWTFGDWIPTTFSEEISINGGQLEFTQDFVCKDAPHNWPSSFNDFSQPSNTSSFCFSQIDPNCESNEMNMSSPYGGRNMWYSDESTANELLLDREVLSNLGVHHFAMKFELSNPGSLNGQILIHQPRVNRTQMSTVCYRDVVYANAFEFNEETPLEEVESWNNQIVAFEDDLMIRDDLELSNITFQFGASASMIIEEGVEFICSDCIFTSCGTWEGITLVSDVNTEDIPASIGLSGGAISHAKTGISTVADFGDGSDIFEGIAGEAQAGIIQLDGVEFRNNQQSILIANSYWDQTNLDDYGVLINQIQNCSFGIDDGFRYQSQPVIIDGQSTLMPAFESHVLQIRSMGYHYENCSFVNDISPENYDHSRGDGIWFW